MDLLTPNSPGGLPTLSLTTNSSWLPRGTVAMPLISPLMPVPPLLLINSKNSYKAEFKLFATKYGKEHDDDHDVDDN